MRPLFHLGKISTSLLILSLSAASNADIVWNGFLSTGGGIASPDEDGGSVLGYEEDATFNNETVLGLQLRSNLSDKLSATGQIVARGVESYDAQIAWAYLAYEVSDSTTLRLGKFRTPYYIYSDFLEVGYAYHWISPPDDVYSLPTDSIEGIDLVYNTPLGPTDLSLQVYAGSVDTSFSQSGEEINTKVRNAAGFAATLNFDWLTFRASHHESQKVSLNGIENIYIAESIGTIGDLGDILNGLALATGNTGYSEAADNLAVQDVKFTYDELAIKIDWNNILFVTEMTQLNADSGFFAGQNRMFATLGYTIGQFMIHTTYSKASDDVATIASTIPTNITGLEATSTGLKQAVDGLANNFASPDRTTNSIGVRWDLESGAALKVEYTEVSETNAVTLANEGGSVLRFAVDAVF